MNDNHEQWPYFRLSHFGAEALGTQSPYRFHDTNSFLRLVRAEVPDISTEAVTYLGEAVSAFYAGCLLASCVMLGVAAEAEFLRLAGVAAKRCPWAKVLIRGQTEVGSPEDRKIPRLPAKAAAHSAIAV